MNNYKLITLTRYISLFMIVLGSFNNIDKFSNYLFFLVLIFLINNQIRYFNLYNKKYIFYISLLLECLFIFILSIYYKLNIFYFIPLIFDIIFCKNIINKYIYLSFILLFCFLTTINISIYISFEHTLILSVISILCIYIHQQELSKVNTQNIYDTLRISEDKLKKSNSDLEVYIDSLEELTILKERNRISREIHDSVGHALSTTIIQLGAIENLVSFNTDLKELVHELREFVKKSLKEVRDAITSLKPEEYENYENLFKIKELINNFSKMTNIDVKMTISKYTWKLSSIQSISLYRIIQEALSNCVKHSDATKVQIFLNFNHDNLIINIKDNGSGCKTINKGNGLKSINERINELNGYAKFNSLNDGFIIHASFPKHIRSEIIE